MHKLFVVLVLFGFLGTMGCIECFTESPSIENIQVEKSADSQYQISWETDEPARGRLEVYVGYNEQEKINEILRDSFSCEFDTTLSYNQIENKCDKPFSPISSDSEVVGVVLGTTELGQRHIVKVDILNPNTMYQLAIWVETPVCSVDNHKIISVP